MIKLDRLIKVKSAVPCPHTCYFYDATGKVDVDQLQSLLGEKSAEVIAWYKFRRSPGFKLTLREKIIHKQLADIFQTTQDLFTTCLLTTEVSDNHSTHLYSQTFVQYTNTLYQPLPMHIVNLSDPNNSYRKPEAVSKAFKNLIDSVKVDQGAQGLKIVGELHNVLQKEIESVLADFSEAEGVFELEEEVKRLKEAVNRKAKAEVTEVKNAENGVTDTTMQDTEMPSNDKKMNKREEMEKLVRRSPRNVKNDERDVRTKSQTVNNVMTYSQVIQRGK